MLYQPSSAYVVLLITPTLVFKSAFGRRTEVHDYCTALRLRLMADDTMTETTYGYRIVIAATGTVNHIVIISQIR